MPTYLASEDRWCKTHKHDYALSVTGASINGTRLVQPAAGRGLRAGQSVLELGGVYRVRRRESERNIGGAAGFSVVRGTRGEHRPRGSGAGPWRVLTAGRHRPPTTAAGFPQPPCPADSQQTFRMVRVFRRLECDTSILPSLISLLSVR